MFQCSLMGQAVKTRMFHRKYLQSECYASLGNIGSGYECVCVHASVGV